MTSRLKYFLHSVANAGLLAVMTILFSVRVFAQSVTGPTLASPPNGAANQPLTLSLQWYSAGNATSYEVQVATDSNFVSPVIDTTTPDTITNIGPLSRATTYYWRVRGTYLLVTTAWSGVWHFTTLPQLPSSPVLLQPQNNAINQSTTITFTWNTASNADAYRLQASTDSTFASTFLDQNNISSASYTTGGFSSGTTYFWRVNSSNAGGTSAWSSVWRFSTAQAVPSAPVLIAPVNGATNQSTSLVFSWNAAANADYYWLQIATDSSFASIVIGRDTLHSTSTQVNYLSSGTLYYWRVKAVNSSGEGGWSSVRNFTTAKAQTPPAMPTLFSPANGATNQPTNPTLSWSAVPDADHYAIQVATDSKFANMVYTNYTIIGPSVQLPGLANGTTYYWQVRAENAAGNSNWAGAWSFTTSSVILPATPALVSPANGDLNQPLSLKLVWNTSSNAASYRVQLSTASDFSTKVIDDSLVSDTTRTISSLTNGKDYYWRVSAKDSNGVSGWSSVWKFTTLPLPPASPLLASPANGSVIDTTVADFAWNASAGAASYHLQNATDSLFHSLTYDDSMITSLSRQVPGLLRGTSYFWRVSAKNSGGTNTWSAIWKFSIAQSAPAPPAPASPPNGATIDSTAVTLVWQASEGATSYWMQISTDSLFRSNFVYNDSTLTTTSKQVSALQPDTKYFWRVSSTNSSQRSSWSQPNNFSTSSSNASAGPGLVSPPDGAAGQSITPTLWWSATSGASSYELQVATDRNFSVVVYDNSSISSTSQTIGPLTHGTAYYWHVRSFSLLFASDWSATWKFTTADTTPAAPPSVPVLVSPANSATNQSLTPNLVWSDTSAVTAYQLQVSPDSMFGSIVYNDSTFSVTSHTVGPLTAKKKYYWHVRAKNGTGWSAYSSGWNFSTKDTAGFAPPTAVTQPPSNVSVTSATLNASVAANGSSTTVNFQYGTALSYGTTVAGTPSVVAETTATAITTTLGGLLPKTTYHYRITAENQGGIVYGSDQAFTTNDTAHGLPSPTTLPATNITSTSATMNASVNPNGSKTLANFQYGTTTAYGNSVGGIPLYAYGDTVTIVSNTLTGLQPNTTYHYRVSTTNDSGSLEGRDVSFTTSLPPYPSKFSLDTTFVFPAYNDLSDYKTTDYRIIGLPGSGGAPIDSLISGVPKREWAAYWDNGAGVNYLVEFDQEENFKFSTGNAFWLIRKGPWTVKAVIPTAPLDTASQSVLIPLHNGWNLITDPFMSPIAWSSLQSVNSTSELLYGFNKNFDTTATFRPYGGYYYFNSGNKPLMKIPYAALYPSASQPRAANAAAKVPRTAPQGEWKIQILFSSEDGMSDRSTWLGISERASQEGNDLDVHKPSRVGGIPSVYFDKPEWDSAFSTFATDIRPAFANQCVWNFDVWSPAKTESQLTFDGIDAIPEEYEVYLLDQAASRVINLRESPSYVFTPARQTSEFLFAVGIKDSLEKIVRSIHAPESFALGNNYPNPFNPSTSIPVEIPAQTAIELKVFNILGEEIRTIYAGTLAAGKYWFNWDGRDSGNRDVASGYYFYRLTTSTGYNKVKKMVLLR
ncbi:MAG: T9SS type A sorting domain-containing protein [Bacteroidota bacterium]|nr:T9SS type A sorting domain-containing protein [Bacteroidota bacterium]